MRWALAPVLLLALVVGSVPVQAHGGPTTYIVTVHETATPQGTVAWFAFDDMGQANPSPMVEPGSALLLILVNAGEEVHELALGDPLGNTTGQVSPGNESMLHVHIPEDAPAEITYLDPGWADRGARGTLLVNTTSPQETPGLGASGSLLALASLALATRALGTRCKPSFAGPEA